MLNAITFLFVFLAIQIAVTMGTGLVLRHIPGTDPAGTAATIVSMALFSAITAAVFIAAKWCRVSPAWLRTRQWGVLLWSALAAVGAAIPSVWLQEQMPALPDMVGEQIGLILESRWGYVAVGLMVPFAEELVFRGAMLSALLARLARPWTAILVSALLFALAHLNPAQMPHALLAGILLGWMYWRTGSILPGIAFHWVNNSVAYVLCNIMPAPDAPLVTLFGGSQRHVWLALLFSLFILVPSVVQLGLRMRRAKAAPTPGAGSAAGPGHRKKQLFAKK